MASFIRARSTLDYNNYAVDKSLVPTDTPLKTLRQHNRQFMSDRYTLAPVAETAHLDAERSETATKPKFRQFPSLWGFMPSSAATLERQGGNPQREDPFFKPGGWHMTSPYNSKETWVSPIELIPYHFEYPLVVPGATRSRGVCTTSRFLGTLRPVHFCRLHAPAGDRCLEQIGFLPISRRWSRLMSYFDVHAPRYAELHAG